MPNNPLNLDRFLVLIPVLNEEASIAGVIQMLQHQGLQHISIADNGSSDRSAEIATNLGAEVVSEPVRGYGQACWVVLIPFSIKNATVGAKSFSPLRPNKLRNCSNNFLNWYKYVVKIKQILLHI